MKKFFYKVKQYISTRNLDQKILLLMFSVLIITSMVILLTTTISSLHTITEKSRQLTEQQLATVSKNTEISLEGYDELMQILVLDDFVQTYLSVKPQERRYASVTNDAFDRILTIRNTKENVNYIAVIPEDQQTYIYSGNTLKGSDFMQNAVEDYESSYTKDYGSMRYSVTKSLNNPQTYSLNLYRPIYDDLVLGKKLGLLCLSLDTVTLTQFFQSQPQQSQIDICITDSHGLILSHVDPQKIGTRSTYIHQLSDRNGAFNKGGKMYLYHEIEGWNFYLVGTIPLNMLLKDTYSTLVVLICLVAFTVFISVMISRKSIRSIYRPIRDIQDKMKKVSDGDFNVRSTAEGMGEDMQQMAENFNLMVVHLEELVQEVKEEQHQIEQIELNALQSQIKPHFLYNTLDCIHWQALVDGNKQISTLVKALANYYRLCLSRGQDVIPLSQELAHIENYLIIQNLRYGDIIQSKWEVEERFRQVLIPKMTLQPLIENSIYHGIKIKNGQCGTVCISARKDGECVVISVSDSGSGVSQEQIDEINNSISEFDESFGYGVRNVHKRIEILFGKGYGLYYTKNHTGGITVDIRLPDCSKEC